jgi:hypothetical protein
MQGAQKLRSEVPEGVRSSGTAEKELKRNAADGLFTRPSILTFFASGIEWGQIVDLAEIFEPDNADGRQQRGNTWVKS